MPNPAAAQLIARGITDGLPHPDGVGRRLLNYTASPGLPPEVAEHISQTTQSLGEAVVHQLETNGLEVVDAAELVRLRNSAAAAAGQVPVVPVHCSACGQWLFSVNITDATRVKISPASLAAIAKTPVECRHGA